ncbi:sugar ABC transporter substrate-binding protein [Actinacidiphila acididurans]|uniref:Substrate-binding domain-containing protein n=1 Tax=Actinacidiphila acididurans TaxID=2784346 RepID=A0ABS2TJ67_9ACTN|nr:substrate-binding domain-containing protein [Actinacidiphila acididurans]MBM9503387.1 substrate-binding domain-containing protein [Actinacidiphila acididurans]
MSIRTRVAALAAAVAAAVALGACGTAAGAASGAHTTATAGRRGGFTVGLLLPASGADRYGRFDKPLITQRLQQQCPDCTVDAVSARDNPATQQRQMNAMITKRVDVMILAAVDGRALRSSIVQAHRAGIPVVAYDRLSEGPISGYVTFDGAQVGRLQAQGLLTAMGPKAHGGQIVMMNGAATDPNAGWFQRGALSVLKGKVRIGRSYDTIDWQQSVAFANMTSAIAALGPNGVDGVLAANDNLATGVLNAFDSSRISPAPPVTGQDADLVAVRRIVAGTQTMTVYKPIKPEARAAADMAVALGRGQQPHTGRTVANSTTRNIPAVFLTPVPVTAGNVKDTLVKSGVYKIGEICTPNLRSACARAGLTP